MRFLFLCVANSARGQIPESRFRLLQLALINRGSRFFGAGGMTRSVHSDADIAATVEAWRGSLLAVREEGALE